MVVRGVPLFRERHGTAGPVGPEPAGLDARELDIPLGLDLVAESLGEALDGPLRRAVDAEERHPALPAD